MRHEKFCKKLYDWFPFDLFYWFFLYSKWTTCITVLLPTILKMFKRLFWFSIRIVSYRFCRAFDGMYFKNELNILSLSQVEIYEKQKVFQIFSIWWEVTMLRMLFILNIRKTIRTGQKEINHIGFIELFMAHLLETISRLYYFPTPRYVRNKICSKNNVTFFF